MAHNTAVSKGTTLAIRTSITALKGVSEKFDYLSFLLNAATKKTIPISMVPYVNFPRHKMS